MISTVAWGVQPGSNRTNRPSRLVAELLAMGVIASDANKYYHGLTKPTQGECRASVFNPGGSILNEENIAVLSPLFLNTRARNILWTDMYDDWSIAPDIKSIYKPIAHRGYEQVRRYGSSRYGAITVNSVYMARRLGLQNDAIVPNGVDERLANLPHTGNDKTRLIVLGNFFRGRTDIRLLEKMIRLPFFNEVIIGGMASNTSVSRMVLNVQKDNPGRIRIHAWMTEKDVVGVCGANTVALIPNLVSDYTLSQDLMKAYTFMALGIPTICPRTLWPSGISDEYVYLTGHGDRLEQHLTDWIAAEFPSFAWRQKFSAENSWRIRAQAVAERIV